jgi:hypothetical protein
LVVIIIRADSSLVDEATLGHKSLIEDEDEPMLVPISEHDGLSEFGQVTIIYFY